jgi:hypothetical protein
MVIRCTCLATLGTKLHHELGIGLAFISTRPHGTPVCVLLILTEGLFGIKGKLFSRWSYPISFFSRTTPLLGILRSAPTVRAAGLLHGRSVHDQRNFVLRGWRFDPMRRNRVDLFFLAKGLPIPIFGIIMRKDRRIPRTIKLARASMKAFGGFVKENVATRQNDLMRDFTKSKGESPLFETEIFERDKLF